MANVTTSLDIVVPVLNEERVISPTIGTLHEFLSRHLADYNWRIVIADNGSTDQTPDIAEALSQKYPDVSWTRLEVRGRGRALRKAWLESDADVVSYMDVDLSTDLRALPLLLHALLITPSIGS